MVSGFKMFCACCPTKADCKKAFGKFWLDKSHDGKGCHWPFAYGDDPKPLPKIPTRRKQ